MKTYRLSVDAADKANVSHILLHLLLLVTQASESINDDTENDVEEQHDDDHHEREIIQGAQVVNLFRLVKVRV